MRRFALLLSTLALSIIGLLLSSVQAQTGPIWCFTYDFKTVNPTTFNGMEIAGFTWVNGTGLVYNAEFGSNSTITYDPSDSPFGYQVAAVHVTYRYTTYNDAEIIVENTAGTQQTFDVQAGLSNSTTVQAEYGFLHETQDIIVNYNALNPITSPNFRIESIRVYGYGNNLPQGDPSCTTGLYPTPSSNPTATATSTVDTSCGSINVPYYYDFKLSGANGNNWTVVNGNGQFVNGTGFVSVGGNVEIQLAVNSSRQVRMDRIDIFFRTATPLVEGRVQTLNDFLSTGTSYSSKVGNIYTVTTKDVFGISPGSYTDRIIVDYTSAGGLVIERIDVFFSGCPLPEPYGMPTSTPAPGTATPTNTPTPTNTAIPTWECTFDFSVDEQGWTIDWYTPDPWGGTYVAGQYWTWEYNSYEIGGDLGACEGVDNCNNRRALDMKYTAPYGTTTVTSVDVLMDFTSGTNPHNRIQYENPSRQTLLSQDPPTTVGTGVTLSWDGTQSTDNIIVHLIPFSNQTGGAVVPSSGDVKVYEVTIAGTGTNTFCGDEPTPTPTITNTPDPNTPVPSQTSVLQLPTDAPPATSTPSREFSCVLTNYSFNSGLTGWTTTGSSYPGAVVLGDSDDVEQSVTLAAGDYYLSVVLANHDPGSADNDGSFTVTYDISGATTEGGYASYFEYQFYESGGNGIALVTTPITLNSGVHTLNVSVSLTDISALRIAEICLSQNDPEELPVDNSGAGSGDYTWSDCGDIIAPPTQYSDTGGWMAYHWNNSDQYFQCGLSPKLDELNNQVGEFRDDFRDTANWFLGTSNGAAQWFINQLIPYAGGTVANIVTQIERMVDSLQSGGGGLGGFGGFGFDLWALLKAAYDALISVARYIGQLFELITGFYNAWQNAEEIPLAGMPTCATAPMSGAVMNSVCAFYYISDNTLFSGALGGVLFGLLVALFNLQVFFLFIELWLNVILMIKGVTEK